MQNNLNWSAKQRDQSPSRAATTKDPFYRVVKEVAPPPPNLLDIPDIYGLSQKPDTKVLLRHLSAEGRLTERAAAKILTDGGNLLRKEANLLRIIGDIFICGDIHGQFYDLIHIFELNGNPSDDNHFLFLGDYVDRGYYSIECVLYLWSWKINHPSSIWLLRGNHECRHLTEFFTFKRECAVKYSLDIYNKCMESFDALPLAALVNSQVICIHGGISPQLMAPTDINSISRQIDPPQAGLMCDLLWADPVESYNEKPGTVRPENFTYNANRGCSFYFTFQAVCSFLNRNKLLTLVRAHEAQDEGYRMYKENPTSKFPSLITIFSAPNYLDVYKNKAAVIHYQPLNNSINVKQFGPVEHPYWLPNFMDAFSWSLPFAADKVTEILLAILNVCSTTTQEPEEDDVSLTKEAREEKARKETARRELHRKMTDMGNQVLENQERFSKVREKNLKEATLLLGLTPPPGIDLDTFINDELKKLTQVRAIGFDDALKFDKLLDRLPKSPSYSTPGSSGSGSAAPGAQPPPTEKPIIRIVEKPNKGADKGKGGRGFKKRR